MTDMEEEIARIKRQLKEAGIENKTLTSSKQVFETLKQLEKARVIKRKEYDLAPPFEDSALRRDYNSIIR